MNSRWEGERTREPQYIGQTSAREYARPPTLLSETGTNYCHSERKRRISLTGSPLFEEILRYAQDDRNRDSIERTPFNDISGQFQVLGASSQKKSDSA